MAQSVVFSRVSFHSSLVLFELLLDSLHSSVDGSQLSIHVLDSINAQGTVLHHKGATLKSSAALLRKTSKSFDKSGSGSHWFDLWF